MSDPRHTLGREGERLAERFLRKRGLKMIARRFNTPVGELDLVMRDGDTVVFVEVKTRRDRKFADPEDSINVGKQRRLAKAACWFLHHKRWDDRPCRIDVVAVILAEGTEPEINHFPDAFAPNGG
ncbi:MAG: YraN family protein [Phycisphaerae bacterium]|nr:YraN family protein [Phycisphaerae bacterium]